jgi:acyl-CoA synthetase (NDP forming)
LTSQSVTLANEQLLDRFFRPHRVAVVGASEGSTWCRHLYDTMRASGDLSQLVPVTPKYTAVGGVPARPSLRDLDEPADLAFMLLSSDKLPAALAEAADAGIKNAVILAGGYTEAGPEGQAKQRQLTEHARRLGMTILGPNSMGFLNSHAGIHPFCGTIPLPNIPGPVALVSQSGALSRVTLEYAHANGIGLSLMVSVGNQAGITTEDVIDYLIADENTRAIALFLESISDADRFAAAVSSALAAGKPVVAVKVGRSDAAAKNSASHTGALSGDDRVVAAVLRQYGVIRAASLEELMSTAGLFAYHSRLPAGRRMAAVGASGGGIGMTADAASEAGMAFPEFAPSTIEGIRQFVPDPAPVNNPLDTTAIGRSRANKASRTTDDVLPAVAADPGIDFVLLVTSMPEEDNPLIEQRWALLARTFAEAPIPIMVARYTAGDLSEYQRSVLARHGLQPLPGIELGLRCIGHAVEWNEFRESRATAPTSARADRRTELPAWAAWLRGIWSEHDARRLLEHCGVAVSPWRLARSAEEAASAAAELGYPVAMKVSSAEIPHKSDIGGVVLDVAAGEQARNAFRQLLEAAAKVATASPVNEVLITPMRVLSTELLIGITVDHVFGPMLAVGLGGVWTEVLDDVQLRRLPVSTAEIRAMLTSLRGARLLQGARGTQPADLDALAETIARLGEVALELGDRLVSVEINPFNVLAHRPEAVDALVVTSE